MLMEIMPDTPPGFIHGECQGCLYITKKLLSGQSVFYFGVFMSNCSTALRASAPVIGGVSLGSLGAAL